MGNGISQEDIEVEKLLKGAIVKEATRRGGVRPGAGRKRGSKNPLTKRAESKERTIKERVLKNVDDLVTAQISLAKGLSYLYKIKTTNSGGKRRMNHILVTDPKEIQLYLDGDIDGEYYYITAQKPDNRAIDSLLDRAFGKAGQKTTNDFNLNVNILEYGENQQIGDGIGNGYNEVRDAEISNDPPQLYSEGLSAGVSESEAEI